MSQTATDRLTGTALRLFQEKGFARVGINEIIREADVARMSLYNNFGSKDDLALAAYTALSRERQAAMDQAIAAVNGPKAVLISLFDLAENLAARPGFRGCAFINLAAQTAGGDEPLLTLVRAHKTALRERFIGLAARSGAADPAALGRQLLALWDGAIIAAFLESDTAPIRAARAAAQTLIGEACP